MAGDVWARAGAAVAARTVKARRAEGVVSRMEVLSDDAGEAEQVGADLETGPGSGGGVGFETDPVCPTCRSWDDASGYEPGAVADGEHGTALELAEQHREAIALQSGDEQELGRGAVRRHAGWCGP